MGCFRALQPLLGIPGRWLGCPFFGRVAKSRSALHYGSFLLQFSLEYPRLG